MPANNGQLEKQLWGAADELRANSKLKSSEYSVPVLGLIFLKYADHKFAQAKAKLTAKSIGRRTIGKTDYQAQGVLYRSLRRVGLGNAELLQRKLWDTIAPGPGNSR